jgi:glucose-6-phosphate 1-dehydrogenase
MWVTRQKSGAKRTFSSSLQPEVQVNSPGDEVEAYERLLSDAMRGDALLFIREDAVEVSWGVVEQILGDVVPGRFHEPGSWEPTGADNLANDVGGRRDPE